MFRDFEVGVWIGFTLISDGDWVWVDNSHVGYTHWAAGEPNLVSLSIFYIINKTTSIE